MDEYVIIICMLGCGSEYNNVRHEAQAPSAPSRGVVGIKKIYNNVRESGDLRKMEERKKEQEATLDVQKTEQA